jgi:CheY-like chemotaxis protein
MDGLSVLRAVREIYPAMPAILLTGYAGDDAVLALGHSFDEAVALLRKPVSALKLLDRLSAMLAAGRDDARQTEPAVAAD